MIKYLVLIGGLWAAYGNVAVAQSIPVPAKVVSVTRPGFSTKVADFDKAAAKKDTTTAEAIFTDINAMANTEFGESRDKMRNATSEMDRTKYRDLTVSQRKLFSDALRMKQLDMIGKRKAIVEKLEQFAATID